MIELERREQTVRVKADGAAIGEIQLSENPCHAGHCYLQLKIEPMNSAFSAELFGKLAEIVGRSLQSMVSSDKVQVTDFLKEGGFECRRKCYEVEAQKNDYIGPIFHRTLHCASAGSDVYDQLCRTMYNHYLQTHAAVSPWTGSFEEFCENLPEKIVYDAQSFAFIEENEIAYVHSADATAFDSFSAALIPWMFEKYATICFESDDCDPIAMRLLNLFRLPKTPSFDTYIRP